MCIMSHGYCDSLLHFKRFAGFRNPESMLMFVIYSKFISELRNNKLEVGLSQCGN